MMKPRIHSRGSRGYSLMEILVVVAIIGVLSLITVPAFINFQRRNAVRGALRSFTGDLRSYRQQAITKNAYVRMQFVNAREYAGYLSRDLGKTWTPLRLGTMESGTHARHLPETLSITANSYNDSDSPADSRLDIDFRPDGTVGDFADGKITSGSITLRSNWDNILNQVVVDLSTTGQIKTTESKS